MWVVCPYTPVPNDIVTPLFLILKTVFLLDAMRYYFITIHNQLDIFPGHYLTSTSPVTRHPSLNYFNHVTPFKSLFFLPFSVASTALNMCLYHTKDPRDKNRNLKIDHIPEETRDLWKRSLRGTSPPFLLCIIFSTLSSHLFLTNKPCILLFSHLFLLGGFVSNNCLYKYFSVGTKLNSLVSNGVYFDANRWVSPSIHPSIRSSALCTNPTPVHLSTGSFSPLLI